MTIYATIVKDEAAVKFESKDTSIGSFASRQSSLALFFLVFYFTRSYLHDTLKFLDLFNPCLILLFIRTPLIECTEVVSYHGVQISSIGGLYVLPKSVNERLFKSIIFIPQDKIRDIIINEAFKGLQVIHYLALIIKDENNLQVLFKVCHVIFNMISE